MRWHTFSLRVLFFKRKNLQLHNTIFTDRKEGNVFRSVCQSVCSRLGVGLCPEGNLWWGSLSGGGAWVETPQRPLQRWVCILMICFLLYTFIHHKWKQMYSDHWKTSLVYFILYYFCSFMIFIFISIPFFLDFLLQMYLHQHPDQCKTSDLQIC